MKPTNPLVPFAITLVIAVAIVALVLATTL